MPGITIVATITVKRETASIARNELIKLVAPSRKESGCIEYILHQDSDSPERFVFYEIWESAAHLEDHKNSDHYRKFSNAIEGMIETRSLNKLTRIA